jgi:adenylate cyclase class IV
VRNLEFKARLKDEKDAIRRARALGAEIWGDLRQTDTYFATPHGRLKLRETAGLDAELIFYERDEGASTRPSDYTRAGVRQPADLAEALSRALGIIGIVRKRRTLLLLDLVRIHVDNVEDLGRFLEIEVPVEVASATNPDSSQAEVLAARTLADLMAGLGYTQDDAIRHSYLDLLSGSQK